MWCVINHSSSFLKLYDTTISTIHFLTTLIINIISAIIIIIKTTRMKSMIVSSISYRQQFYIHRHLIASPILLICLILPRLIISYLSTCMKPTRDPYFLLTSYFISF
jgi:hypothetical protein